MLDDASIQRVTNLLAPWEAALGRDVEGYGNHVQRVVQFCLLLRNLAPSERLKVCIAACFHDLGIWTADSFDYLAPSIRLARTYLDENGLAEWEPEIVMMIDMHHKLTPYTNRDYPLVELFRWADLIDLSLGGIRFGLSKRGIRTIKSCFPNRGFHGRLTRLVLRSLVQHPLNPLPMYKW